VLYYLF